MSVLKKVFHIYDTLLKWIIAIVVGALAIIVFAQVISRYVFSSPLSWSEELAWVLFTQVVFLAAPLVILEKKAIAVDIIQQFLSRKVLRYLNVLITVISFVFFCFLAVGGWSFAIANMHQTTTALRIPMGRLYTIIPVSSVMMAINCLRSGLDDFLNISAEKKEG